VSVRLAKEIACNPTSRSPSPSPIFRGTNATIISFITPSIKTVSSTLYQTIPSLTVSDLPWHQCHHHLIHYTLDKNCFFQALLIDTISYTFPFLQSQPFSVFLQLLVYILKPIKTSWDCLVADIDSIYISQSSIDDYHAPYIHVVTMVFVVSLSDWTPNSRQKFLKIEIDKGGIIWDICD
jgi:hypothetical protein